MTTELNTGEPVAWKWYESQENTNPYTQITGYSQLCYSEIKPDENVKVDEGTLIPLYHQDYVNQLLGEIEGLKARLATEDDLTIAYMVGFENGKVQ